MRGGFFTTMHTYKKKITRNIMIYQHKTRNSNVFISNVIIIMIK